MRNNYVPIKYNSRICRKQFSFGGKNIRCIEKEKKVYNGKLVFNNSPLSSFYLSAQVYLICYLYS